MNGFFGSRWIEAPAHATEVAGGLPKGFRAAGVACGLKPSGAFDLGLLACSAQATTSAARFTRLEVRVGLEVLVDELREVLQ